MIEEPFCAKLPTSKFRAPRIREYYRLQREISSLCGIETAHPPKARTPRHSHNVPIFFVVLEGSLTEVSQRSRRKLTSGDVLFVPAGEMHYDTFEAAGGRSFVIKFLPPWNDRLLAAPIKLEDSLASSNGELTWLAMRLYKEFRCPDDSSILAVEGLALEVLAGLCRQQRGDFSPCCPTWLHGVREQLHDRFSESIKLEELAGPAGVHPAHLCRAFRQHFLCSLGDYQRRLRVEHSCRLLLATNLALVEVALSAGFSDQAHFSRVFKKSTRMTPAEFRQLSR